MNGRDQWDRHDVRRHRRRRRAGRRPIIGLLAALVVVAVAGAVAWTVGRDPASPPTATVPPPTPLTFPEGLRREDMARLLEEKTNLSGQQYLELTKPGPDGARLSGRSKATSLEGFLFPATYGIGSETTVEFLVDQQVRAYEANVAKVDMAYARSRNLTPFDVLIIASMVEREVAAPAERATVAGVVYNRLRNRMRLDIDATVQYAVGKWRPLTAADLESDSPYNTRRFAGLPPGPISNPGLASLQAAARPRASRFLYYVAREDGTDRHYFAATLEQFEVLKAKARAKKAAGTSPSP
jgi:UPF0755 protein